MVASPVLFTSSFYPFKTCFEVGLVPFPYKLEDLTPGKKPWYPGTTALLGWLEF